MKKVIEKLRANNVGKVELEVSLDQYTSYRVGGMAKLLIQPESIEALQKLVILLREADIPWTTIGWGSNLIVDDSGFNGAVIRLGPSMRYVRPLRDDKDTNQESVSVVVGAATMNNHLVRDLHKMGLSGAEFLALIPGTFGGSLIMNAGTKRGEIAKIVEKVKMVMPDGSLKTIAAEEAQFAYRHSSFPRDAVLVEGQIRVRSCGSEEGAEIVRQERDHRNRTQPYYQPCAGSVFRNPQGDFAGRLIEAAGLKGMCRGKARISPMHANFIVTEEGASGRDILALMAIMRRTVKDRFDVTLEPEQRLLGYECDSLGELLDKMAGEDIT